MKELLFLLAFLICVARASCQDEGEAAGGMVQQLENLAEQQEGETDDDSQQQQWNYYRHHPLNLNTAGEDELRAMGLLTELQVINLVRYRQLLGNLVSVYELQAVPGWNIELVRRILPLVTVMSNRESLSGVLRRFRGGDHTLLLRYARVLQRSSGYQEPDSGQTNYYKGSPARVLMRYKYNYKNQLQYGVIGDKDAGEQLFKGAQQQGFDFYSLHLFVRGRGHVQSLALGDYTVSLGQGLIQWQSLAFGKSALVTAIKRQGPVVRPYTSAGEFNFHRGAAVTVKYNRISGTFFASARQLGGNAVVDTLSGGKTYISSLQASGYHRTASEIADRNSVRLFAAGGNLQLKIANGHVGVNSIHYTFSLPLSRQQALYNLFAFSGKRLSNYSFDWAYTLRNAHVFGEVAVDDQLHAASVAGVIVSMDAKVDASVLYRNLSRSFHSLFANAFTESASPANERGVFAGISVRPKPHWQIDAYMDIYRFPWLRYQVDAPAAGVDYLLQATFTPDRNTVLYSSFRFGSRLGDVPDQQLLSEVEVQTRRRWRIHVSQVMSRRFTLTCRTEMLWLTAPGRQRGWLFLVDAACKPVRYLAVSGRLQYFETGGFESRIYAYENDVAYSYSVPGFYDKGWRTYINIRKDVRNFLKIMLAERAQLWVRFATTFYPSKKLIGSGLDGIEGSSKSDVRLQLLIGF